VADSGGFGVGDFIANSHGDGSTVASSFERHVCAIGSRVQLDIYCLDNYFLEKEGKKCDLVGVKIVAHVNRYLQEEGPGSRLLIKWE
jgi:hypothetical protein